MIGSNLTSVHWLDNYSGAVCNNHENKENSHFWCKTNCAVVLAVYFTLSPATRAWVNEVFHSCYLDENWLWRERAAWDLFFFYSVSYPIILSVPTTLPSFTLTCETSKKWIFLSQSAELSVGILALRRHITMEMWQCVLSSPPPATAHTLNQDISLLFFFVSSFQDDSYDSQNQHRPLWMFANSVVRYGPI